MTRMHFDRLEVVWVKLGTPDRKPMVISSEATNLVYSFNKWRFEKKNHVVRTIVSGGGHFEGLFLKKDWNKIEKWLTGNGFKHGPTQPSEIRQWCGYEQTEE